MSSDKRHFLSILCIASILLTLCPFPFHAAMAQIAFAPWRHRNISSDAVSAGGIALDRTGSSPFILADNKGSPSNASHTARISMPEDISFVIDPYEIAEKGQIYSDDFVFENRGNQAVRVHIEKIYYDLDQSGDIRVCAPDDFSRTVEGQKNIYMFLERVDGGKFWLASPSNTGTATASDATAARDSEKYKDIDEDDYESDEPIELINDLDAETGRNVYGYYEADTATKHILLSGSQNGDEMDYSFVLEPVSASSGSSAVFRLTGEVNEKAEELWQNGDVKIALVVSYEIED